MINHERLNKIHNELSANKELQLAAKYIRDGVTFWSWELCSDADTIHVTTDELRQLWVAGMVEQVDDGFFQDSDLRFQYGRFQYAADYLPPAYLQFEDERRGVPCWMN